MKSGLALVTLLAFPAVASAQTLNMNQRKIWDGTTEFTSRGNVGSSTGFVSQAFPFGAIAGVKTLTFLEYFAQDQDLSTQEPWNLVYCGLDPQGSGNPDYAGATMISANNALPISTGIGVYRVTHTLNTPALSVKLQIPGDRLIIAWQFTKTTNWVQDGLGIHMSEGDVALPNNTQVATCFNFQARNYHREMNRVEGTKIHPGNHLGQSTGPQSSFMDFPRSWHLDLGFDEVTLNGGIDNATYNGACMNPNYGYGGLDPDFNDNAASTPKREDDFVWQVQAGARHNQSFAFLISSQAMLNKPISTTFGDLWLNPTGDVLFGALGLLQFPQQLDATGTGVFTFQIPSALRPLVASLPSWSAQVLVVNGSTLEMDLSTVHTMRPFYDPALCNQTAWKQGAADSTKTATIPRPVGAALRLFIRNDGPGIIDVDEMVGTTKLRTFSVNERVGHREFVNPGGTSWVVRGRHQKASTFVWLWNY